VASGARARAREKLVLGTVGRLGRHPGGIGAPAFTDRLVQENRGRNGQDQRQRETASSREGRGTAGPSLASSALGQESPFLGTHRVDDGSDLLHEALALIGDGDACGQPEAAGFAGEGGRVQLGRLLPDERIEGGQTLLLFRVVHRQRAETLHARRP
jgi:hypothetical protein